MSRYQSVRSDNCDLHGVLPQPLTESQWALVHGNMGLVGMMYTNARKSLPDLTTVEQERLWDCLEARLIRAAQSYRPELGWQFSTFACVCMCRSGWEDFQRASERQPRRPSLSQEFSAASDDTLDVYAIAEADVIADLAESLDLADLLMRIRRVVGKRDADMIERRYIHGDTLEVMGKRRGCSKERIRQVLAKALEKLRRRAAELGREEWRVTA